MTDSSTPRLPHALSRVPTWAAAWRESGGLVLLLDFDGTLAPIVERPQDARIDLAARDAVERLIDLGAEIAIVSGRGLSDARDLMGIPEIAYAGNHGMEIEMPGLREVHPEAASARPSLDRVVDLLAPGVAAIPGALVEDKGLTLSIHYRLVERDRVEGLRREVHGVVSDYVDLRVTEGKEVLEVRPKIDWHKGKAVEFLIDRLDPPAGAPLIYIGDDMTDEDAFETLKGMPRGEGVLVAEPLPARTEASSFLRTTKEVAQLIDLLAESAPV